MKSADTARELYRLRTDTVQIGTLENDYESGISFVSERTAVCDMQPYNEAALEKGYGHTLTGGMKMYTDPDDPIDIGDGVKFDGRLYRAVRSDRYGNHKRVILEYTRSGS